jgi:transposase
MILAHRIRLAPTRAQAGYFVRACGVARFSYNWALVQWQEQCAKGKAITTPSAATTAPTSSVPVPLKPAIEDLNVAGTLANRHVARAIADLGFFEFRRQLDYKAVVAGSTVMIADRW